MRYEPLQGLLITVPEFALFLLPRGILIFVLVVRNFTPGHKTYENILEVFELRKM